MLVVVIVGVVAGGCLIEPPPFNCDCPELERVAGSIDWVEGEVPSNVVDTGGNDEGPPTVISMTVFFEGVDPEAAGEQLIRRLTEAGLQPEGSASLAFVYGSGFEVSFVEVEGLFSVRVSLVGTPDEQAEETLAPVIDALGLRGGAGG